ncbi:hypothetical protein I0C86_40715 [Plantactinospora sp. S1510]|uniref:Uncharacterized protein n=1 Tax=Plantactinospora alkalitolerans TaxID=2789879 RepID=A0ABS0HAM6_9ACTN|nr:hypothetical protein [Plantactinospora alkalitolerans]MBF9135204.1 hypothetical protein [Plantactinospora alkalitolerans]
MGVRQMVGRAVEAPARLLNRALWAYSQFPAEWGDYDALLPWLEEHARADSGVWAIYRNGDGWEAYAPGSPDPAVWPLGRFPHRTDPIWLLPESGDPDGLPVTAKDKDRLRERIGRVAEGTVAEGDIVVGARYYDEGCGEYEIVVLARVTPPST